MPTVLIVDDNAELASLLAVVADASGIRARLANSGREALASLDEYQPDAALVDLLLPDMRGHDVIQRLTAQGVPCFAMSGVFRGESLVHEALHIYGAKGFFEKPFVARELMERLAELLELGGHGVLSPVKATLEDLGVVEQDPLAEDGFLSRNGVAGSPDPAANAVHAEAQLLSQSSTQNALGGENWLPFSEEGALPLLLEMETFGAWVPTRVGSDGQAIGAEQAGQQQPERAPSALARQHSTRSSLDLDFRSNLGHPCPQATGSKGEVVQVGATLPFSGRDVWRPVDRSEGNTGSTPKPTGKTGSIAASSIPRLMTALHLGQQTGELRLARRNVVKVIGFSQGMPVSAVSNLGSDRFAQFSVRAGLLPEARLFEVQDEARRAAMKTSEAMVALGFISSQQRQRLIEQQVKHIIWSTFDWEDGEHLFVPRAHPRSGLLKLSLSPGLLILEGVRATFSLVRLRQLVPANMFLFPTADPPYPLQDLELGNNEALVLAHADGSKTVEDLLVLSDLAERDALALLQGLVQTGILEPRESALRRSRVVLV